MSFASNFPSSDSQKRWRAHMTDNYIKNHRIRPCVFQVPDNLRDTKPEAYIPQIIGLGPYHHFRPEVQLMSSKKREAVQDYLEIEDLSDFTDLVNNSHEEFEIIRSCYDRYLDLEKETLSWIVIVDGIVLLHFIDTYLGPEAEKQKIYPDVEKLVPDFFKLENQIPIILILEMLKVLELTFNTSTATDLSDKFRRFIKENSPLQLTTVAERKQEAFDKKNHMLHFMYKMVINNKGRDNHQGNFKPVSEVGKSQLVNQETFKNRVEVIARVAADHVGELFHHVGEEFNSALAQAENAGLNVPGNIQKVSQLLQKFESTFRLQQSNQVFPDDKIEIPSVSRLAAILNIKFMRLPDDCGIGDIELKAAGRKYIFYLPVIHMRSSSEVIFRNLVAYEATLSKQQQQGSTRLRDYVDLMCGLIKSDKDVQLLKDAEIIDTQLPNQEIANMCQRIKKSDEMPDDQSVVHKTVQGANNQFNKCIFVVFWREFMKIFTFIVKIFRALFPFLIFIFLGFQSACEIVDCRVRPNGGGAAAMRNLYSGDSMELDPQAKLMLPRKLLPY